MVEAAPAPESEPTPDEAAPITEHVKLEQVGENTLEDGQAATHAPDGAGRKKWNPKEKS
ncbi:hypothetical protein [Deinococcus sp.]|uniref:hypothetical protein n=1 Tax=Deinococcus sp. TaxID=47478 RepID=UPI002869B94B|nr:hypothetical protein [Deinococcus sp.]